MAHDWIELTIDNAVKLKVLRKNKLRNRPALACPACQKIRKMPHVGSHTHMLKFLKSKYVWCNGGIIEFTDTHKAPYLLHSNKAVVKISTIYFKPTLTPVDKTAARVIAPAPKHLVLLDVLWAKPVIEFLPCEAKKPHQQLLLF